MRRIYFTRLTIGEELEAMVRGEQGEERQLLVVSVLGHVFKKRPRLPQQRRLRGGNLAAPANARN
jgi:ABC-type branched-subunit amino acid transport system ATPase component